MKINHIILLAIAALFFNSCEKNEVRTIDSPPNGAFVRGYNFAVNGPSVNFYINDTKISATSSATGSEATTGVGFAGIFPANNNYLALSQVGSVVFKSIIPAKATANPGVVIATVPATIEAGKFYSLFTSGIYDSGSKTTSGFILEDVLPQPDTSTAYVRFVNTIPNATNGFDLKAVNTTTSSPLVISAVTAYKSASEFVKVPNGVYNLTSTSVNLPVNYVVNRAAVSFVKGFVYTIAARGNVTVAGNLGLDLTRNR